MELCSLHPLDPAVVQAYVATVLGEREYPLPDGSGGVPSVWLQQLVAESRRGYERANQGQESGANAVTYGLAKALAVTHPSFAMPGLALTTLEARIDRGVGMLVRPPSRLLREAGLSNAAAHAMPIRLDLSQGLMGGAFVPAHLVPRLEELIENRLVRFLRRLREAEYDEVAAVGLLLEAIGYARERNFGLYEALDVVAPDDPAFNPPGAVVIPADRKRLDKALRARLEEAAKPPKQPGLIARLFGRRPKEPELPERPF